jgi:hypothetical protein
VKTKTPRIIPKNEVLSKKEMLKMFLKQGSTKYSKAKWSSCKEGIEKYGPPTGSQAQNNRNVPAAYFDALLLGPIFDIHSTLHLNLPLTKSQAVSAIDIKSQNIWNEASLGGRRVEWTWKIALRLFNTAHDKLPYSS